MSGSCAPSCAPPRKWPEVETNPCLTPEFRVAPSSKAGGVLIVTFSLASPSIDAQPSRSTGKSVNPDDVGAFIAIDDKGMVTLYSGKVELGTGAVTAITQMAAEELSVPFGRVTTIQGDTALTPSQGPTYASLSIQDGGVQIRRAAATAREALLERGRTHARSGEGRACRSRRCGQLRDGSKAVSYCRARGQPETDPQGEPVGAAEGPEGLHDRRQARYRDSTFPPRSSGPSTSCRT